MKNSKYLPGLLLSVTILIAGIMMEWIHKGRGISLPSYPASIIMGLTLMLMIILCHFFFRRIAVITLLSGKHISISIIIFFALLILCMGLIKQDSADSPFILKISGLNHIQKSFIFYLSAFCLLFILGLVILRRLSNFNLKNIGFGLNHIGLWIVVFGGTFGSADLFRLNITMNEGQTVWFGFNSKFRAVELPFTIKLLDFSMKEHQAKILVVDESDPDYARNIEDYIYEFGEGTVISVKDWNIKVIKYIPNAERDNSGYHSSADSLSYQAALLQVRNEKKKSSWEGWISTGNHQLQPDYITLDSGLIIGMTIPEPKEYSSKVEISTDYGISDTAEIMVNKPLKIRGYMLYQYSYDKNMGKHSSISVLEAVKDPWLSHVYTGINMLIAGTILLLWTGKNRKN